jgi:hypothetical protein
MEAAAAPIVILGPAGRTQCEWCQGSLIAIVGQAPDDCESRTTIRAIEKRVAVSPVRRVEQLNQAIRASRHVWADMNRACLLRLARLYAKRCLMPGLSLAPLQFMNLRQWRRMVGEFVEELIQSRPITLDFDNDVTGLIFDKAAQSEARSQAVHKWPEPDTLHQSVNENDAAACDAATPFCHPDP